MHPYGIPGTGGTRPSVWRQEEPRGTLPGAALLLRSAPIARERHVGLTSVPQHLVQIYMGHRGALRMQRRRLQNSSSTCIRDCCMLNPDCDV